MQDIFKFRAKACQRVANAKVIFLSHSGIVYFAKVGPWALNSPVRSERTLLRLLDNLYICDACDAVGVPDLMRRSGEHTTEHHLIRCLEPEKIDANKASPTEQRLAPIEQRFTPTEHRPTSIEGRVDVMQAQLDELTGRVGDLTSYIGDLNARMGNIEQLLHRLVGAPEGRAA